MAKHKSWGKRCPECNVKFGEYHNRDCPDFEMGYYRTYHPEFGADVYQPMVKDNPATKFIEPYVTEKEAKAFLEGVQYARSTSS